MTLAYYPLLQLSQPQVGDIHGWYAQFAPDEPAVIIGTAGDERLEVTGGTDDGNRLGMERVLAEASHRVQPHTPEPAPAVHERRDFGMHLCGLSLPSWLPGPKDLCISYGFSSRFLGAL
ncbi:MAG: hypothetical protein SXV54_26930 [Chloroflexota bacterium]|nr:hypothetical protein [Chloroflexota bacterium]